MPDRSGKTIGDAILQMRQRHDSQHERISTALEGMESERRVGIFVCLLDQIKRA